MSRLKGAADLGITIPGPVAVQDENVTITTGLSQIDFQGAGVSVAMNGSEAVVTVPGATTPTAASIGAAKSTVGAGTPSFIGRNPGDLHFNSTAAKELVLTGAPGVSVTDGFGRANGALIGSTTETGSKVWAAGAGNGYTPDAPQIYGNRVRPVGDQRDTVAQLTATGAVSMTCDVYSAINGSPLNVVDLNAGATTYYYQSVVKLHFQPGVEGFIIYIDGNAVGGATTKNFSAYGIPLGQTSHSIGVTMNPTTKAWTAVIDGITVGSGTFTGTAGTQHGFNIGQVNGGLCELDNFALTDLGTLAWSDATTAAALGLGTNLMNYKGAWSPIQTYSKNDVVTRAYGLYVALSDISLGADPIPSAASNVGATAPDANWNFAGADTLAQAFTVSSNITITSVQVPVYSVGATVTVGIASNFSAGGTPTYLGSGTITGSTAGNGSPGTFSTITLDAPVALVPATTYRLVISGPASSAPSRIRNNPAALSGAVATVGPGYLQGTGTSPFSTNDTTAPYHVPFILKGSAGLSAWQKIANTGNQQNVGQVGASGSAVTIADPELQPITRIVLTANSTITLPTVASGKSFTVTLVQDSTGSRTVTWAGGAVIWIGGSAPTLSTAPNTGDVINFFADGNGNWLGYRVASANQALSSGPIAVQDENATITTGLSQIDFQGAGVSVAMNGTEAVVTIPGGNVDSTSTHYKGDWSAASTYVVNDEVSRAYGLYIALVSVPSNSDPLSLPTTSDVGGTTGNIGNSNTNGVYRNETVLNLATLVGAIQAGIGQAYSSTFYCTIKTTDNVTIAQTSLSSVVAGMNTFTFSVPVNLAVGTYWIEVGPGAGTFYFPYQTTNQATDGRVTSIAGYFYGGSSFGYDGGYRMMMRFIGTSPVYWKKIANFGADPAFAGVAVQDENVTIGSAVPQLDFQGAGVSVAMNGSEAVVTIPGSLSPVVVSKMAAYTMVDTDTIVLANGTFTVTLPVASTGITGKRYTVKNTGTGTITVAGQGASTIDGASNISMTVQYSSLDLASDGTNWFTI